MNNKLNISTSNNWYNGLTVNNHLGGFFPKEEPVIRWGLPDQAYKWEILSHVGIQLKKPYSTTTLIPNE